MKGHEAKWGWFVVPLLVLGAGPALATSPPTDATVSHWVTDALRNDPRVDSSHVNVTTSHGTVKLTGEVRSLAAREYADLETKKIDGVKGVVNELVVTPEERDNRSIADDTRRHLKDSPLEALHHVDVTVDDGVVGLRGEVSSWSEKSEAGLLASEVLGVREVQNDLRIQYPRTRPDEDVRKDVEAAISRDVYLAGLPISVRVRDGVVTLTGSVGSAYTKERATNDAWVNNTKSVKNRLDVEWWENAGVRKAYPNPSDSQIQSAVESDLTADLRIADPYGITADCLLGHVTLRGKVPTYYEKRLAERDSKDVVGVGWVTNDLVVSTARRSPPAIRSDIESRFDSDYLLNGQDLRIQVKDGIVTLKGNTNTSEERHRAVEVASRVPGVVNVVDDITVNWIFRFNDGTIAEHVRDRLRQHSETKWTADSIHVDVDDGNVTLTGDVPTWSERREAARVAFMTDGVKSVDDRVKVEGVDYPWDDWYLAPYTIHEYDYYDQPFHPAS